MESILALPGLNNLAAFLEASIPALSESKLIIIVSNVSKNSRFSLISFTAPPAPFLTDTTGHLDPSNS